MARPATGMIKSMTGYGRHEAAVAAGTLIVEVRAVNHRFCEVMVRLPKALSALEDEVRRSVQQRCARGRIDVSVSYIPSQEGSRTVRLDQALAIEYYRVLRALQRRLRLAGTVDVTLLASFRDLVTVVERPVETGRLISEVKRLLRKALADVDTMRRREGAALKQDLESRIGRIEHVRQRIETRLPNVVEQHLARMKARLEQVTGTAEFDDARLRQELALFADRSDISEELTRLQSHLTQCTAALKSREPVGKRLDFLLQEMGREVNTLGSKASDAHISGWVVDLKGELEKIREQIQNIE